MRKNFILSGKSGIAALPLILLLGGLIVEVIVTASLSAYLLVNSEYGMRLSAQAFLAANSGINDALLRITRDKNFTSASYELEVGQAIADISVCKDLPPPDCAGSGKRKITAVGSAQSRQRKIEAVAGVDDYSGAVRLESLSEIPL